ncbi:amyloid fiber anchoring/assembly protein TapA [Rossellomorea sp. SC111]|uniref:amyloid fiber anchoring/assembly protein TapA n=1 Tax=Rossellomorea sp. SC111 TaxID=2968985 RepID=UPI00215A2870|nr:amyloid fiber anchoring/assembly protein TapA [Rossellomorea sp. SC111]MCR8850479.1 amyloid fiber anchoring/assembly protein TapA [Rossellomorea sp. SC111]
MISIRYPRTRKHKTPTKKWKLLCQLLAIWYATTITSSFIDGNTGAYFNDQDQVTGVITAGTWSIWDKSSLNFPDKEEVRTVNACSPIDLSARIMNTGSTMQGTTEFAVYYAAKGNPKNGNNIVSGDIQPINKGETATLKANVNLPGNYKFKALQRPGHGNKEDIRHELWSETITIECEQEKPEAPDKGGEEKKPETPEKKDSKVKENKKVSVPEPTPEKREESIKEKSPAKEDKKQEPEQPAAPAEPETNTEEQVEGKAASEQSEIPPKEEEPPVPSPSISETSSIQE